MTKRRVSSNSPEDGIVDELNGATFQDLANKLGDTVRVGEGDAAVTYTIEQIVAENTIVSVDANGIPLLLPGGDPATQLPMSRSDKSYGRLAISIVPGWLLGFFAAVIFGAILSSFNSGLNSAATLFSVDIYKAVFRKEATEAEMVRMGKILGTAIALGAICVAPLIQYASGACSI